MFYTLLSKSTGFVKKTVFYVFDKMKINLQKVLRESVFAVPDAQVIFAITD